MQINRLFSLLVIVSFMLFSFGCTSSPISSTASTNLDELDTAIREASDYLINNLPHGNKLVILNFQSEYQALSEYVIDELITNSVNDKVFTVVDRANLALIQREINFQLSGEVNDETAVSIGRTLGAQIIISGAIPEIGDLFRLRVRALDVETSQIKGQFNRNIPKGQTIALLTNTDRAAPTAVASDARARPIQQPLSAQETVLYKIGDTGPAGGIVFYDKGNNIGGWRYLEAAPEETERTAGTFSPHHNELVGSRKIGDGKENTKKFIELFRKSGGGINTAPWFCNELSVNGYNDWYLPSLDELLYIYNNLYSKGLGGFKNGKYWSSYVDGWMYTFCVNFSDGSEERRPFPDSYRYQVRAIRQF